MVGWTDPIGQPALIGKATYDFSIVKLMLPQTAMDLSNLQLIAYSLMAIAVLLVTLTFAI